MKKIFKFLPIIFLMVLLPISCKAALDVPHIEKKPKKTASARSGTILVRVAMNDENFPSYRTVTPDDWTEAKKERLSYVIYHDYGTASPEQLSGYMSWNEIKGGYYLGLNKSGEYRLTMLAVDKTDTTKIALKSDVTTIRVPGISLLTFVLRPYRKDTALKGTVDITFKFLAPEAVIYATVDKAEVILQKVSAGAGSTPSTTSIPSGEMSYTGSGTDRIGTFRYSKDIPPGKYMLTATLYNNNDSVATTHELLIVDPANTSTKTILITREQNTTQADPYQPTNFRVQYKRPGDTDTTYNAVFSWKNNANDATGFTLEILDENEHPVQPQPSMNPSTLPANTTKVEVKLDLGKKYKARVRAKRGTQSSKWTDLKNPNTNDLIHLARITYNVDGGGGVSRPVYLIDDESDELTIKAKRISNLVYKGSIDGKVHYGYYTQTKEGFLLPGSAGLPCIYAKYNMPNVPTKPLIGWAGAAVIDGIGFRLKSDIYENINLQVKWEDLNGNINSTRKLCYIEGRGRDHVIITQANSTTLTVKPATVYGIDPTPSIKKVTWYVDGESTPSTTTTPTEASLSYSFTPTLDKTLWHVVAVVEFEGGGTSSDYCDVVVEK